jgi:hypothetical protein
VWEHAIIWTTRTAVRLPEGRCRQAVELGFCQPELPARGLRPASLQ